MPVDPQPTWPTRPRHRVIDRNPCNFSSCGNPILMFLDIPKSWDEGEHVDIKFDAIWNIDFGFGVTIWSIQILHFWNTDVRASRIGTLERAWSDDFTESKKSKIGSPQDEQTPSKVCNGVGAHRPADASKSDFYENLKKNWPEHKRCALIWNGEKCHKKV